MLQDDGFLPYSINSALTATTPAGVATNGADLAALPRLSLDSEIFTTTEIDYDVVSKRLRETAYLMGSRGVSIALEDQRTPQRTRADVIEQPIIIGIGREIGPLIRVAPQVKELG